MMDMSQFASRYFQLNQLFSNHVEKADTGSKTSKNVEFCVEDCRSVSNSAGFECISQPGDTQIKKFKFGSPQYMETCSERFD